MGDHRDLAAWDAGIETDFQLAMAGARAAGRRKRGQRLVGFPFAFMADVCQLTSRRASLVVAVLIYRRTFVVSNRTVTLPAAELAELGIDRRLKNRALAQLAAAGLVRIESDAPGRAAKVTLLWKPE
jgi:hypothetical protein